MKLEKRVLVSLEDKIIAIFKSDLVDVIEYVNEYYNYLNLYYEDINKLKFKEIYIEL